MKLLKWIARNKRAAFWLFFVAETVIFGSILLKCNAGGASIAVLDVIVALVNAIYVGSVNSYISKGALDKLNNSGDPEPLLAVTMELMENKNNEAERLNLIINHCVALREMGELERARDMLEGIDIDKSAGKAPYIQFIYYHNYADICRLVGDIERCKALYGRAMQIYEHQLKGSAKDSLRDIVLFDEAHMLYDDCDMEGVLDRLDKIKDAPLTTRVEAELLRARVFIKKGMKKEAMAGLDGVIATAPKLYAARVASELKREIEE